MQLPLFYIAPGVPMTGAVSLPEENSRHIAAVLRMQEGEQLQLTDGQGNIFRAEITLAHKKRTEVRILQTDHLLPGGPHCCVAIALLKNAARFEWFLEKATELGIRKIIPLLTDRTEKQHYKEERFRALLISAMMQSGQSWLPELSAPLKFDSFLQNELAPFPGPRFLAHCLDGEKKMLSDELLKASANRMVLIGPEGDFSTSEIHAALSGGAIPVSLGNTRLRAETAGVVAASLLMQVNQAVPAP